MYAERFDNVQDSKFDITLKSMVTIGTKYLRAKFIFIWQYHVLFHFKHLFCNI